MRQRQLMQWLSLGGGPLAFVLLYFGGDQWITETPSRAILAITAWMAIWWIFESVPLAATSLLPLILMPLTGVLPLAEVGASYGHKYIFLFLGGFLLALAIEKCKLHWRIALHLILAMGAQPRSMLWGFMLATALLSMWISNTATTIMMLPMALAVIRKVDDWGALPAEFKRVFGRSLLLGIAYGASIGGMATLIGSPPNLIFAGMVEKTFGESISFLQWLEAGLPVAVLLLLLAGSYLGRGLKAENARLDKNILLEQKNALGKLQSSEKKVLLVFGLTALAWMFRTVLITPFFPLVDDTIIALLAAMVLFAWPAGEEENKLLDWKDAEGLPWGVLLLFGGGIALAAGFDKTGTAGMLAGNLSSLGDTYAAIPFFITVGSINFLTEITSNLATTAVVLPVLAPFADALNIHPYLLMTGATLAASCAFMLPVGTPPNAIVFASGKINIKEMVRIGIVMNLLSILIIALYTYAVLPLIWGI